MSSSLSNQERMVLPTDHYSSQNGKNPRGSISVNAYKKGRNDVQILAPESHIDLFLTTIKRRGFFPKATKEALISRANILDYQEIGAKIERFMELFENSDAKQTFASFIINYLLQTQHELALVEDELLSLWASVYQYSDRDTVMLVYHDFLNDILKGPTHLSFYCQCQRIITQIINGDTALFVNRDGSHKQQRNVNLAMQYIRSERLIEVVQRIFTPSVILQIYEESLKEKKSKETHDQNVGNKLDRRNSVTAAWRKNMKSNHNLDLSGVHAGTNQDKQGLTNEQLKHIQNPSIMHNKILSNILNTSRLNFDGDQGLINAKDLQIQCLFEYEKIKSRNSKKRRQGVNEAMLYASIMAKKKRQEYKNNAEFNDDTPSKYERRKTLFGQRVDSQSKFDSANGNLICSSSEESDDDSNYEDNKMFYSVDRVLRYQGEANVQVQRRLSLKKRSGGSTQIIGNLGSALQTQITSIANQAQYKNSMTKVSSIHDDIQAEKAKQIEKIRLLEQRKRQMQGQSNMMDRIEEEVNLDMQLKIDAMMSIKKSKEQKIFRNNPPKKEALLKDSKDNKQEVKFAYKQGQFGPSPQDVMIHKLRAQDQKIQYEYQNSFTLREEKTGQNYAAPGPSQMDNYAVQKMYVRDDLSSFKNAETRLKQIMLKLNEQEKTNKELKAQITKQNQQQTLKSSNIEKKKVQEITGNIQNILYDINGLVQENIKLKESQGVPVDSTVQTRQRLQKNLYDTQKVLGVENPAIIKDSSQMMRSSGAGGGNSPQFAGKDFGIESTRAGSTAFGNSQPLTGIGSLAQNAFGVSRQQTVARLGFSDRYSSHQASVANVNSQMEEEVSESVQFSETDESQKDPNKLYTPVTTILMSFEVKRRKSQHSGFDEDQKLMTIIESEEISADQTHNQSHIVLNNRQIIEGVEGVRLSKQNSQNVNMGQGQINDESFFNEAPQKEESQNVMMDYGQTSTNKQVQRTQTIPQNKEETEKQMVETIKDAANSVSSSKMNLGIATDYINDINNDVNHLAMMQNTNSVQSVKKSASQLRMDELKKILHQRGQSEVSTHYDTEADEGNKALNEWPITNELDPAIQVDAAFLMPLSEKTTQWVYTAKMSFHAYDPRHINLQKGQTFIGLQQGSGGYDESEWIFGCSEDNLTQLGFVPVSYLEFIKERNQV